MLTLRASSMPIISQCAGAARASVVAVTESTEPARLGTAVHEALRPLVEVGEVDWSCMGEIAARHSVGETDVRVLVALAVKLWPSIKDRFPDALTEVPLSTGLIPGIELSGHLDIFATLPGNAGAIGDWKTGRKDSTYAAQMRAYCALVLFDNVALDSVTALVIWIRDGEIEQYAMDRAGLKAWLAEIQAEVVEWDGRFRPGTHCGHCPRSHECPAANALARRDAAAMLDAESVPSLELMAPEQILELNRRASSVTAFAERVKKAIKAHVDAHGDVVAPDARLTIVTEPRRELDPAKAWPVLEGVGFGDEDFARVMDLSIGRVEKVVAEKAGKGRGAAAVRALSEQLNAAGAVSTTETRKLVEKRN